jgi:DNA repair protein RadD
VMHGIIAAGFEPSPAEPVQVASVQSLVGRLDALVQCFDFIVIDECHHTPAATWRAIFAKQPKAKKLGVTATPARLDGKGLGVKHGGIFDAIVCGPPIAELIEDGYLARVRCFVPNVVVDTERLRTKLGDYEMSGLAAVSDRAAITGDAVEQYRKRADHRSAIAFCVTVTHARHVAEGFRAAGYRSDCVHGDQPTPERDRLIAGLGSGEIEVLTSCEIISEGLDIPAVGAVILLRPTKSLTVYLQQIGRGMRPAPGKDALVVLDHGGTDCRTMTAPGRSTAFSSSRAVRSG